MWGRDKLAYVRTLTTLAYSGPLFGHFLDFGAEMNNDSIINNCVMVFCSMSNQQHPL